MKLHGVGFNETRFGCTRWKTWEQAGLHVSHERLCSDPYPSPQHLGMLQRYASLEDCMLEVIGYIRYPYRYTYIVILLPIICPYVMYDNIGNTHGKLDEPLKGLHFFWLFYLHCNIIIIWYTHIIYIYMYIHVALCCQYNMLPSSVYGSSSKWRGIHGWTGSTLWPAPVLHLFGADGRGVLISQKGARKDMRCYIFLSI